MFIERWVTTTIAVQLNTHATVSIMDVYSVVVLVKKYGEENELFTDDLICTRNFHCYSGSDFFIEKISFLICNKI